MKGITLHGHIADPLKCLNPKAIVSIYKEIQYFIVRQPVVSGENIKSMTIKPGESGIRGDPNKTRQILNSPIDNRARKAIACIIVNPTWMWTCQTLGLKKATKNQYEKAYLYTENDDNDLGYFITYHVKTMVKAFEALKEYIGRKQKEVVQAAKFMKIPGVNDRMAQILKIIYDDIMEK